MKNHTNLRVADTNTAPQPRPALRPARQKLEGLIEQRALHERKIKELGAAADRLADVLAARHPAAAEVREFDKLSEDMPKAKFFPITASYLGLIFTPGASP